jgi:tRNA 2-thiouridine synthesizing protein A
MSNIFDKLFDARGLNCPMPLVNARKEVSKLEIGQVLKVMATDRGSVSDFQGWARIAKNVELVAQETESTNGTNVFIHYVKRTA